jgi:hypothetical protein
MVEAATSPNLRISLYTMCFIARACSIEDAMAFVVIDCSVYAVVV